MLDRISDNLAQIKGYNKELRSFLNTSGSNRDSKVMNDQISFVIEANDKLIQESSMVIREFKEFKFPNNSDKMTNLKQLKVMESKCSELKTEYDTLIYKIKRVNKSFVDSQRQSKISNFFPSTIQEERIVKAIPANEFLLEDKINTKIDQINLIDR